jgi:hypothetical protein
MLTAEEHCDNLIAALESAIKNARNSKGFSLLEKLQEEKDYDEVPFSFTLLEKHHDKLFCRNGTKVTNFDMEELQNYVFRIPKEGQEPLIVYGFTAGIGK